MWWGSMHRTAPVAVVSRCWDWDSRISKPKVLCKGSCGQGVRHVHMETDVDMECVLSPLSACAAVWHGVPAAVVSSHGASMHEQLCLARRSMICTP